MFFVFFTLGLSVKSIRYTFFFKVELFKENFCGPKLIDIKGKGEDLCYKIDTHIVCKPI